MEILEKKTTLLKVHHDINVCYLFKVFLFSDGQCLVDLFKFALLDFCKSAQYYRNFKIFNAYNSLAFATPMCCAIFPQQRLAFMVTAVCVYLVKNKPTCNGMLSLLVMQASNAKII